MTTPFVKSNFERVPGDYYPTIDKRCVDAFLQIFVPQYRIIDPCSPNGSGIVDALVKRGHNAVCAADAFGDLMFCEWIVTNPPYERGLVDRIINRQIERVEKGEAQALAVLLRSGFDHAKSRATMFDSPLYAGQIKLRFRPWWSTDHAQAPIHNFVWQIWRNEYTDDYGLPHIWYADGNVATSHQNAPEGTLAENDLSAR